MQNQALITCIFSLHIDLNWSLAGCHTFATKDRYIQASRSRVHLLSALFYPTLPHSHLWLHPVNHTSQIAPWLQSTLKWWKWIKLITDSQRESWAAIKSCVWPAAVHSSALLYDRRPGWVPVAFLRQSPSIRSTSAETFCERCHRDWCLGLKMWFCYNKTNELLGLLFYVQLKSHCLPLESETNYFLRYRNNGWTRESPGPLHTSQLLSH